MSATAKMRISEREALSTEKHLRDIAQTVMRLGKDAGAAETEVHLDETLDALTRFANNGIHQNVAEHGLTVSVRTALDGKTARVATNKLDHDSLRGAVESALSLAASQPKAPNLLSMPGKQHHKPVQRYVRATAELSAEDRARAVRKACDFAVKEGQVAAGIFVSGQMQSAVANSRGLFVTHRQTRAEFSITMQQDPAAGWAKGNAADVRDLDPQALAQRASTKARFAANAVEVAPGKYTVILEPAAVLDLVGFLFYDFSATAVEDKRSCLNERMGKPLFGKNISLTDDVYHAGQLGAPFDGEGMPRQKVGLVDKGVPRNLVYGRVSAKRAGKKATGHGFTLPNEYGEAPMNLVFAGGKSSVEEMIATTQHGLLVTRLWYIREVDPYEKVMTGMTRDGLFRVEKGKVTTAARNFRFNQSVLEMLRNVEMLSPSARAAGEESFEMVVPAMKIKGFQFTEVTKF